MTLRAEWDVGVAKTAQDRQDLWMMRTGLRLTIAGMADRACGAGIRGIPIKLPSLPDEFIHVDAPHHSQKGCMVNPPAPAPCNNLGFLSVYQDGNNFVGGYLVTNSWGRPLEFRLSGAVQPNKVQQILYGSTLTGYLCGEVIGKTLLDKTAAPVQLVIVDNPVTLDLRHRIDVPVALWHAQDEVPESPGLLIQPRIYCHTRFPEDVGNIRAIVEKLGAFDFGEPFARIREAMNEARRMGVATRNAA